MRERRLRTTLLTASANRSWFGRLPLPLTLEAVTQFVRYQSAVPNRHGRFPGVFALANGLRDDAVLSPEDHAWLVEANRNATAAYVDPTTVDSTCYDTTLNPGARSWFAADALKLLEMTAPYLDLLDRYSVPWV